MEIPNKKVSNWLERSVGKERAIMRLNHHRVVHDAHIIEARRAEEWTENIYVRVLMKFGK